MRLRSALLIICTEFLLVGCISMPLPEIPEVTLYGIHGDFGPPGFYGVNNKSKEMIYKPFDHKDMKGGQCFSAGDAKKYFDWQALISEIAEKR